MTGMHVVAIGSPFDGIDIVGPFKTGAEAVEWADRNCNDVEWNAVPLKAQTAWVEEQKQ
ncbi:hypothetical protein ACFLEY_22270 [Bradyrhizobium sp. YCK136]